ncbi:MAG TPA: PAS domain S-box protein [Bacteroidota bacterium]|nr:PAS domain S-box protein [Bacteroidota bacterium]
MREERVRRQMQPESGEETFRLLFHNYPFPMWVYDPATLRFLEVNEAAIVKYGYAREEFLSMTLLDIRPPEEKADLPANAAIHRPGLEHPGEWRHLLKDGTLIDVVVTSHSLLYQGRQAKLVIVQDVTRGKIAEKKLKESAELLRSLFDNMVEGFAYCRMIWDGDRPEDFEYLEVNKAFLKISGLTDVTGKRVSEVIPGLRETNPELFEIYGRVARTGRPEQCEVFVPPLQKWGALSVYSIEKGYFVVVYNDITDRKRSEEKTKELAAIVNSSDDAIIGKSLEGIITSWNRGAERIYGYSESEVLGKSIAILIPPGRADELPDILDRVAAGDHVDHFETLRRRKDGRDIYVSLTVSPILDIQGNVVAASIVGRDVSDRKLADLKLRQSEEQFRLIAENITDMIAIVDTAGTRLYNSPSYTPILGTPESLRGTSVFRDVHPDDRERVAQTFRANIERGIPTPIEYRLIAKDGSVRDFESRGGMIRDEQGVVTKGVIVSRDVTDTKREAAERLRAQRMESIGTLAAGIAHDLNNVLSPILMAIDVLRTKIPDARGLKILNTIDTAAKRGSDIVRQVLAFGRGVTGERILVQVKHIANEVVKIAGGTFPKSIEIRTDFPRDLWTISADPTQMHQVILNLLVNARDAMPRGGLLTIAAANETIDQQFARMQPGAAPGHYVVLTIVDTGTGIPPEIREKIFDPFFTTKEVGMGTGLGLSTTLAIIKSHNGFITLSSEAGRGTTFRVYLPATGNTDSPRGPGDEPQLPTGNGETILVIDDEAAIREITRMTLESFGYRTLMASDGAEGTAIFVDHREEIKAVITDIMMPVMDGAATILALKKIDPDVKIIAASGLMTQGKVVPVAVSGVDALLTKPYTAEKLLKTLAAVLH